MPTQPPVTRTMKISEVKRQLSAVADDVSGEQTRVLVEKNGVPVAALVSPKDLARLAHLDREREERERRFGVLDRMREAFKDVPLEEIERETAKAVAEVRAEMEAERLEASAATV